MDKQTIFWWIKSFFLDLFEWPGANSSPTLGADSKQGLGANS